MRKVEVDIGGTKTFVDVPDGSDINVRVIEDDSIPKESPTSDRKVLKGAVEDGRSVLKG